MRHNFLPRGGHRGKVIQQGPDSKLWNKLPNNSFYFSHAIYDKNLQKDLLFYNYKHLFIYRDPRDQIVSYSYYAYHWDHMRNIHKDNHPFFIQYLIQNGERLYGCKGITNLYHYYLPWLTDPYCCAIKFEDLIGPKGGGNLEKQLHTIERIANFIGISISEEEIQIVADKLFGSSLTFRSGQIGSWKTHFNERHKQLFKKIAGNLLIELGYENDYNW